MESIKGKNIVLGVCGGIAAYKSVELLRLLKKEEAIVRVMMTQNACRFVGPMTFEALSGHPVTTDLFDNQDASIRHIEWAQNADAVVIAPATANIIGKYANGIADDALSTFLLAVTAPVMICPSMNTNMYQNPAVLRNLEQIESDGRFILVPKAGALACGATGPGRLPEPPDILDRLACVLTPKTLKNKKVLVTAGPTREPIDPVRFISNPSSGKMGYAIARAAEHRGADVVLISGPVSIPEPLNVSVIKITTAKEMADAVFTHAADSHIIIKAAAVSDFRPKSSADQKIKKQDKNEEILILENTQDILKELGKRKKHQALVGFAAETEDLMKNAQKKLDEKNLDIIVGNLIGHSSSGFGADKNLVTLFYRDGLREELPLMDKFDVANFLLDRVMSFLIKL